MLLKSSVEMLRNVSSQSSGCIAIREPVSLSALARDLIHRGDKMNPSGKVVSENHCACFRAGKLLLSQRVQSVDCTAGASVE